MRSHARPWWADWKWDDEVRRYNFICDRWFELNHMIRCELPGWSATMVLS